MLNMPELSSKTDCVVCPTCGRYCRLQDERCPQCRRALRPGEEADTHPLVVPPAYERVQRRGTTTFDPAARLVLEVLPAQAQIVIELHTPLILGRTTIAGHQQVLDLTPMDGYRHGVSRRHCQLTQRGTTIIVMDLGSANGTYLNGERLPPHHEALIADGDQLILGTLHLTIRATER